MRVAIPSLPTSITPHTTTCIWPHTPSARAVHKRTHRRACTSDNQRANAPPPQDQRAAPPQWLQELETELGVRVVPEDSHDEGEDSDEDWEEVMSALDSPWSVDGGGDDDPPLAEGPLLLPSEAAGEDTQQQEEPFTRIQGAAQLQQLLEATPGLVVLDVHSAPETDVTENTASASLSGETDATGSSSTSVQGETPPLSNATDGGSITSSSVHVIPIHELSGDRARVLAAAPGVIVLNGPDHRGVQACVRLSRVYHAPRVFLYST